MVATLKQRLLNGKEKIYSLDIENLYPSIPVGEAINILKGKTKIMMKIKKVV